MKRPLRTAQERSQMLAGRAGLKWSVLGVRSSALSVVVCAVISLCGCLDGSSHSGVSPNASSESSKLSPQQRFEAQEAQLKQTALVGSEDPKKPRRVFRFFKYLMGTRFNIHLIGHDQRTATNAARTAFNEVARVERLISSWRKDSEIGALNLAAGESSVPISYESAWLLCQSRAITSATDGAFDVTWAALKGQWDFRRAKLPRDQELKRRLSFVGIERLSMRRGPAPDQASEIKGLSDCDALNATSPPPPWTRFAPNPPLEWSERWEARLNHPEAQIDLGGIGKGFGIDQAARTLVRLGYQDFLVDGGGDLYASGRSLDESPWSVGIAHPRDQKTWGTLWIPSGWSVVTSGDYERYFKHRDVRYHHIIDLRTGYPARASVAVTVVAQSALLADAYATALFVLGPRSGLALAELTPGLEAIFFAPNGEVSATEGAQVLSHKLSSRWR